MKLKLFKKYFLMTSVIIIFSFVIMMMIFSFVLNNYIAKTKYETLDRVSAQIGESISVFVSGESQIDRSQFHKTLNDIANISNSDVFVVNADGKVWICGCDEWGISGSCEHSVGISLIDKLENFETQSDKLHLSTLDIYRTPHYISVEPLYNAEGELYSVVFTTAAISAVRELLSALTQLFLISAFLPIVFIFISVYVMTYRLTKPLKMMSQASKAMAKGDFSKRIPVTSDDEIGELAASFNMMTNSLSQLEGMRRSFVANVSHELKTPMTTIGGFIDGILDETIEPEKHRYYLTIVSDEVKRLSRLVQSMLSMARLESGEFSIKPELFDFREMICTIVVSQEQQIEKQGLEIEGLDTLPSISIKGDKDLLHQALYNIVDNAIKFTNEGGKIRFSVKSTGKKIICTVFNTGKGINQKDLPFVFERFFKGDKSRSAAKTSTGLGLYIVKTIVTAHSGTVSVTSRENEFTEFKITLPSGE